nr:hypothetical protein [Tanacetum cinerariifolium]
MWQHAAVMPRLLWWRSWCRCGGGTKGSGDGGVMWCRLWWCSNGDDDGVGGGYVVRRWGGSGWWPELGWLEISPEIMGAPKNDMERESVYVKVI